MSRGEQQVLSESVSFTAVADSALRCMRCCCMNGTPNLESFITESANEEPKLWGLSRSTSWSLANHTNFSFVVCNTFVVDNTKWCFEDIRGRSAAPCDTFASFCFPGIIQPLYLSQYMCVLEPTHQIEEPQSWASLHFMFFFKVSGKKTEILRWEPSLWLTNYE